jgi:hypothetical protein
MMTDEQRSRVAELRTAIAGSDRAAGGASREIRAAVLVLKQELRRAGTTARVLAGALGIHETTLCRWEREGGAAAAGAVRRSSKRSTPGANKPSRGASFRMVRVAAPEEKSTAALSPTSRGLRAAHAPSGIVIEGLDVDTLAALLRRLS